ncbi:MAG TPA: phosphotransferase [Candidatus Saccharimonadia bacterium]|nr:phosphotransferase [Candidatus Saccharimonadia bacterium]
MPGPEPIAALIPHQGSMCLNERIVAWDAHGVRLATTSHRSAGNPLRRDGRLRALHLAEYGAQAMAVHGGLVARAAGTRAAPGLLVSLRALELHCDYIEALAGELEVEATKLAVTSESWQYEFAVRHAGELLARGRAAVMARTT